MTPAVAARRKVIGQDLIGGEAYRPVLSWFSALVNHAGNPAIAIPLTIDSEPGLPPPSLQLIAPWWQEEVLIAMALRLEQEGPRRFPSSTDRGQVLNPSRPNIDNVGKGTTEPLP